MDWKTLLAYITGTVDQELLLRTEYLVTENRLLRKQLEGRVRLTDGERKTLAAIGEDRKFKATFSPRLPPPAVAMRSRRRRCPQPATTCRRGSQPGSRGAVRQGAVWACCSGEGRVESQVSC